MRRTPQDSLYNLYIDFVHAQTEAIRNETSSRLLNGLKSILLRDTKAEIPFDSLKKYKVMLQSPDKQVRIFTWDVAADDGTHTYYGFINSYNKKSKQYEVFQLTDKSEGMKDPENAILDNTKWYGAYYYQLSEVKYKKKKYYTLLGWDGNNRTSNKRLIDVLYFTDRGFPKFGDAIFESGSGKVKKRIIFEYKAGVVMHLKFDDDPNVIVFDHLSPSDPNLEGQFDYYGPDFKYDMLEFKKGRWEYIKDIDARNDKNKTDRYYKTPH